MIQAACIVGKNNEPIYFYCNPSQYISRDVVEATGSEQLQGPLEIESIDPGEYLHLQMLCHSCVDIILEKKIRCIEFCYVVVTSLIFSFVGLCNPLVRSNYTLDN